MADVFISYARKRRDLTVPLADALTERGYSLWWDFELIAGERFSSKIIEELDAAGAVIVIWTEEAQASTAVEDEARRAHDEGKLISVLPDGVSRKRIPIGLGVNQTTTPDDVDGVVRALENLGVAPTKDGASERTEVPIDQGKPLTDLFGLRERIDRKIRRVPLQTNAEGIVTSTSSTARLPESVEISIARLAGVSAGYDAWEAAREALSVGDAITAQLQFLRAIDRIGQKDTENRRLCLAHLGLAISHAMQGEVRAAEGAYMHAMYGYADFKIMKTDGQTMLDDAVQRYLKLGWPEDTGRLHSPRL